MVALTAVVLVDPAEVGRPTAVVPALVAMAYVPAIWASVAPTPRRQKVLQWNLLASMALAFATAFMIGSEVLLILMPATVTLWLATGGFRRGRR